MSSIPLRALAVLAAASTALGFCPAPHCLSPSRVAQTKVKVHAIMMAADVKTKSKKQSKAVKRIDVSPAAGVLAAENKMIGSVIDSVAEMWVCPITGELPLDPVTAEDGHIYERGAIESYIRRHGSTGSCRSPLTNQRMGPLITTCVQARDTIEQLVRSGLCLGDKAASWRRRIEEEEAVMAMRARADRGDGAAMYMLGKWLLTGDKGLPKDETAALKWFREGSHAGDASAVYNLGICLFKGTGGLPNSPSCKAYGMGNLFRAAEMGSALAAFDLGEAFDEGRIGLPADKHEAMYWYSRVRGAKDADELPPEKMRVAAERVEMLGEELSQ